MADQLQLRRGTTAQIATFTGAQGEVIVDTDKDTLVVQDGVTAGGFPLASESVVVDGTFYFNDDVSGGSIANSYILSPKANTNTPTSYMDGQQYGFVTANANTGPSTATFSDLGVKSLKYRGGIDPVAGDISGRVYLIYDSANDWFEIQSAIDYLNTVRINVASTATVDLTTAAPNTRHIDITGTTTITGFTVTIGECYFVRFTGSLTLTNSASLVTQSGENIITKSGDTCLIRATAANAVEVMFYTVGNDLYTSPEQTITAAGLLTLAHGLGVAPKLIQCSAVCKVADLGYSVGDVLLLSGSSDTAGSPAGIGLAVTFGATSVDIRIGDTGFASGLNKATGASGTPILARWRLVVRAWA